MSFYPRDQTPSHTQFNRSSSRQSAKRLLLALLRLICSALYVIVTFRAAHMSCRAMSPHFPLRGTLPCRLGRCGAPPGQDVAPGIRDAVDLHLFPIHFFLFTKCGFSCLLAPPVHLSFIMQLFWAWSQIFRDILATPPPLPTHTHTHTHTHTPSLSGWGH